jgi:uncharacterized protein YegP (UPF0339 family)
MSRSKFEIKESTDGRYYFRYKAENGWILCHSELYSSKTGCLNALESVRRGSYNAEIIDLT